MAFPDSGNEDLGGRGMNKAQVDKWLKSWDERIDQLIKLDPPNPGESLMEYYAKRIVREEDQEWFRDWWKKMERLTELTQKREVLVKGKDVYVRVNSSIDPFEVKLLIQESSWIDRMINKIEGEDD